MHSILKSILTCPKCNNNLEFEASEIRCDSCRSVFACIEEKPVFNEITSTDVCRLKPKEPGGGSWWRQQNWAFIKEISRSLKQDNVVLEIGCGRGYFSPLFKNYIGTDIYLSSATHFTCDLTKNSPVKNSSVDVILMNNLLEHVYEIEELLDRAVAILKKNGLLAITIPNYSQIHYVPFDYWRLTNFGLLKLAKKFNLRPVKFEAVCNLHKQMDQIATYIENRITGNSLLTKFIIWLLKLHLRIFRKISFKKIHEFGRLNILNSEFKLKAEVPQYVIGYQILLKKL